MKIWVDADACPRMIKEILYKAVERTRIPMTLVANRALRVPESELISTLLVPPGLDVADEQIVAEVNEGDLVVTADIPLASAAIKRGAFALNPRGSFYTETNIGERLAMRDLLTQLRNDGEVSGGPAPLGPKDRQEFANQLDKFLTRYLRSRR